MAIGAKWHLDGASFETAQRSGYDPLTDASYAPPIPPISLDTPTAELADYAKSLLAQEARLFEEGVTCSIKGGIDVTCLACPIPAMLAPDDPRTQLCRISQEQERVGTVMAAKTLPPLDSDGG